MLQGRCKTAETRFLHAAENPRAQSGVAVPQGRVPRRVDRADVGRSRAAPLHGGKAPASDGGRYTGPAESIFTIASRASAASWAAWVEADGRPPRSEAIVCDVISVKSLMVRPVIFSVRNEAQAIDAVQPRQRKRASCTIPAFMRTARRRISPQTGLLISTCAVGSRISPALRGF